MPLWALFLMTLGGILGLTSHVLPLRPDVWPKLTKPVGGAIGWLLAGGLAAIYSVDLAHADNEAFMAMFVLAIPVFLLGICSLGQILVCVFFRREKQ